jgi:hypothetical protein
MFVQYAVKNIRCDPSRRETWHFGWQCESLRGHFDENISEEAKDSSGDESAVAWGKTPLACEYAKYKNRLHDFTVQV